MPVKIPIITVFDSKGLKQAQFQLNKVRGNVQNLGRNFAIAGAAIGVFGVVVGKAVKDLARIEAINAQTNAVLKSMGTTANGTAKDIENLAGRLENLTATEAETIQEGANLLLTFKNIQNQAGAGNDIFDQTVGLMVDLAQAMGTTASGEAIRLGKALNDPVKGIAALTRVGIQFTDQQKEQIKALTDSGDLMGAQKIILAELQSQFGGSGAAFAQTFTGQLQLMNHELGAVAEEAAMTVLPALQGMVTELRLLIPVIGPQLKAAIESVDFKGLVTSLVKIITFFVKNAEVIGIAAITLFTLNTAYHLGMIALGLYNAVVVITNGLFGATSIAVGLATVALRIFRTALILTGIGALVVGLGFVIEALINFNEEATEATPVITSFGTEILKTGDDAKWAAGQYGILGTSVDNYVRSISRLPAGGARPAGLFVDNRPNVSMPTVTTPILTSTPTVGGGSARLTGLPALIADAKKQGNIAKRETKLIGNGLSAAVAGWITSSSTPIKAAAQAQAKIAKNGQKAIANLTRSYNKSSAGQEAAASAAAEASQAAAAAAQAFAEAQAETLRIEAEALAERKRIYESFQQSVQSTFSEIKNSILGAFDITGLGGSTNAIIRNMKKLLDATRSFSGNISKLAGMGLDPALLQQVISAGPLAGARLANALVAGGAGAISEISKGFGEFTGVSSDIASTGVQSLFNRDSQQTVYNINVDGGVGSGATIGQAIVEAIKAYERTSGAVWQGA